MITCSVGFPLLLPSNSKDESRSWHQYFTKILGPGLLLSAAIILWNYAFVDLSVSFIQCLRIASFPLFALMGYIINRPDLNLPTPTTITIVITGIAIFLLDKPVLLPVAALPLLAIALEAAATILTIQLGVQATPNLLPNHILVDSALICAAVSMSLALWLNGNIIILHSMTNEQLFSLALNVAATLGMHITTFYMRLYATRIPLVLFATFKDVLVVVLSVFDGNQFDYQQLGGYCIGLFGLYVFQKRVTISTHQVLLFLAFVSVSFYSMHDYTLIFSKEGLSFSSSLSPIGRLPSIDNVANAAEPISYITSPVETELAPFSAFLKSHGIDNNRTLFVTMASKQYIEPMINFNLALKRWNRDKNYVVLCLDIECLQAAEAHDFLAYDGYLMRDTEVGHDWHASVARMKFAANIDLIDGGYNFVLLDGDVYLTGSHDPLSLMVPLDNPDWHIQFQSDQHNLQDSEVNIGWYWARPTSTVRDLFVRSRTWWNQNPTGFWDQRIMNSVRTAMIREESLNFPKSIVLNLTEYKSTMSFDWTEIYTNETLIDSMNQEGVVVHYTMIFGLTKIVVAKQFGHWLNETYYTQSPKILRPVNIAGNTNDALDQLAFAVYLSKISNRSFMWPNAIQHTCPQYVNGTKYRPPILIADVQSVDNAVPWVEGTYFRNRQRYTNVPLNSTSISLNAAFEQYSQSTSSFLETCRTSDADVLTIDFAGFDIARWRDSAVVSNGIREAGVTECHDCGLMSHINNIYVFDHVVC